MSKVGARYLRGPAFQYLTLVGGLDNGLRKDAVDQMTSPLQIVSLNSLVDLCLGN